MIDAGGARPAPGPGVGFETSVSPETLVVFGILVGVREPQDKELSKLASLRVALSYELFFVGANEKFGLAAYSSGDLREFLWAKWGHCESKQVRLRM